MSPDDCARLRNPNAPHGLEVITRADVDAGVPFVHYLPGSNKQPIRGTFLGKPWYTEDGWMVRVMPEDNPEEAMMCLRGMGITTYGNGTWSEWITITESDY